MRINNYSEFLKEENRFKSWLIFALMSLGLNKTQAQSVDHNYDKVQVVKILSDFNKNPTSLENLKSKLRNHITNTDDFIKKTINIENDKIKVKPNFNKNLEIFIEPKKIALGLIDNPFSNMSVGLKIPIDNKKTR